jgi:RNA polymerase sigma factor (sigma-70 family)
MANSSRRDPDADPVSAGGTGGGPAGSRADRDAFAAAYDRHATVVQRVARGVLADPAAAEDVVHEVFLRLWERPAALDSDCDRLRAWLCTAARHRAIDRLRRTRMELRYLVLLAEPVVTPDTAAEPLLRDDLAHTVREAVGGLPEPLRTPVVLAYYGGYTYREVAAALGIAEGTAKSRVRIALRRLAALLVAAGVRD